MGIYTAVTTNTNYNIAQHSGRTSVISGVVGIEIDRQRQVVAVYVSFSNTTVLTLSNRVMLELD